MISNSNSKGLADNANRWEAYGKHTDMNRMLENSLSDLNLTKPRHQTPVSVQQPTNTSNGPTTVPLGAQYRYSQPQQAFYQHPLDWVQGKGSIPPLYQQVTSLCADPRQSFYMLTDRVQPLLISSGLDQEKLKAIWNLSCRTVSGVLTVTECCTALGLVALAQQGHEISMDKLASLSFIPIPRIDTTRCTPYQVPAPPPVRPALPVIAANRTAPLELHGFGELQNANNRTIVVNLQDAGSKQEFGNFQSASPTTQVPPSLPVNSYNTEEFGQLNSASLIQPCNTELTSAVSGAVLSDASDRYSCFRDIGNVQSLSANTTNQDTAQASGSGADDKYAFLRALDVTNEPKETLPPLSVNSTLLQPTQTTNDPDFSAFKSADSASSGSISQCDHAPIPSTSTSLVPGKTSGPGFSDLSDFSVFLTATTVQCTTPSEAAASSNSTEADWSPFISNVGTVNSNLLPDPDIHSALSPVQGDPATLLSNLSSNLGQTEAKNLETNKQQTTTDTDWTAFTTTTVPNNNDILPPNSDKYSSLSQSAVVEQLCVLPPSEPSAVSETGVSELQTVTDLDWSAFSSSTTNQNPNSTTTTGDKYSALSQSVVAEQLGVLHPSEPSLISAAEVGELPTIKDPSWSVFTSLSITPTATTTTTTEPTTAPISDKYSVFPQLQSVMHAPPSSSPELLSTQKLMDYPLPNNTSLPPIPDACSLITESDQNAAAVTQPPVVPPTERDLSQLPAQHLTDRNTPEDLNYNEPPPLDDVSNDNDTSEEDFNYSGFNSFPEFPELKSKRQVTSNLKQKKLSSNSNLQNEPSVPIEQALSSDAINPEVFETQPTEVTPLAAPCSSLFAISLPTLPTDTLQLDATENDLSTDPEEKTPLAHRAQVTCQGDGGSQLENEFSFFYQFQTAPGDNKSKKELNCNFGDLKVQSKGSNDFSLPHENFVLSQNMDFSEFSSFQKTSDFLKPESPPEENPEGNEQNLQSDSDPFQDLSSLSSLQSNDLMKGLASKPQEPKWTLFDTLATALQEINSVPIDNYKNQKFQPISGIQREESFARRSPLPPEPRSQDFEEFIGASNTGKAHEQLSRAPSYKLSEDSSKEVKEAWSQTLSACVRVIHLCYEKVKSATSVQILKELCTHDTSHQYFESVFEVMKIVSRIKKQLPADWEESNLAYENITEDWANIKAYLNHGGLEFSDVVVSAGADSDASTYHCGVCLDVITRGDIRIALGGFNYHSTCANFWLNEVGSMLPRLSRESHGTSL